jgi:hypothetical protein
MVDFKFIENQPKSGFSKISRQFNQQERHGNTAARQHIITAINNPRLLPLDMH